MDNSYKEISGEEAILLYKLGVNVYWWLPGKKMWYRFSHPIPEAAEFAFASYTKWAIEDNG